MASRYLREGKRKHSVFHRRSVLIEAIVYLPTQHKRIEQFILSFSDVTLPAGLFPWLIAVK